MHNSIPAFTLHHETTAARVVSAATTPHHHARMSLARTTVRTTRALRGARQRAIVIVVISTTTTVCGAACRVKDSAGHAHVNSALAALTKWLKKIEVQVLCYIHMHYVCVCIYDIHANTRSRR